MRKEDIDNICSGFLKDNKTPEDYLNGYMSDNNVQFSFEEGTLILDLLNTLQFVDSEIIKHIEIL